jgi:hypothetical protein
VIAAVPRDINQPDQVPLVEQASGHPAQAVWPDLISPARHGATAMCVNQHHHFRVNYSPATRDSGRRRMPRSSAGRATIASSKSPSELADRNFSNSHRPSSKALTALTRRYAALLRGGFRLRHPRDTPNTRPRPAKLGGATHITPTLTSNDAATLTLNDRQHAGTGTRSAADRSSTPSPRRTPARSRTT